MRLSAPFTAKFLIPLALIAGLCRFSNTELGAAENLSPRIVRLISEAKFKHAHWGILVSDMRTGDTLYELNAEKLFAPASTTKLYSVACALDELGADYRFETPIYERGIRDSMGHLDGDLILVASGDPTMGGRTDANGEIAFTGHDHTYANSNRTTELTAANPLAGLDDLAHQVARSGLKKVRGTLLIDTRLFEPTESSGSGPKRVTPIMINDNLIDVVATPTKPGMQAAIEWRPRSAKFNVRGTVGTVAVGEASEIEITNVGRDAILVEGTIAADHPPMVRVHSIEDPEAWARHLAIEALQRAGVEVADKPISEELPKEFADEYKNLKQIAVHRSPPFSENVRLILKVSHNLHASTLPLLVACKHGKLTLKDGLRLQGHFLKRAGVSVDEISFGGAAGGDNADFTTTRATVQLLRYMATRPDYPIYSRGLPSLGVDGTLSDAVDARSPARGNVRAKTGTLYWYNAMNDRYLLTSKALAGYLTSKSGRRLVFSFVTNGIHLEHLEERNQIGKTLGQLCEIVFDEQ